MLPEKLFLDRSNDCNVYTPNSVSERQALWEELQDIIKSTGVPWCLGGNFNVTMKREERIRRSYNVYDIDSFRKLIEDLGLIDMPMIGGEFTYRNFKEEEAFSRLDRFLVSGEFLNRFSKLVQRRLPASLSDHNPKVVEEIGMDWGSKPFKFSNHWLDESTFPTMLKKAWEETKGDEGNIRGIWGILKDIKPAIKEWKHRELGNSQRKVEEIEMTIQEAEEALIRGDNSVNWRDLVRTKRGELWKLHRDVEREWHQKSRVKWYVEGDRNTKFFHSIASSRKRSNFIPCLTIEDQTIEEPQLIKEKIMEYFQMIYREDKVVGLKEMRGNFKILERGRAEELEREFTEVEVWEAIESYDRNKAPGPNVDIMRKDREGGLFFKVDFEKAYDTINWGFLDFVLDKMRFGGKWRSWIRTCISTARISVLVNGVPTRQFRMRRGLRQRCLLSSFLFNCVTEAFSVLMSEAISVGLCKGIEMGHRGLILSHLQFADDTTIMCKPEWESIKNVKRILRCFQLITGLRINFQRSSLFRVGLEERMVVEWAGRIGCRMEKFPSKYLGIPLGVKNNSREMWRPVVKKFEARLVGWKGRLLSMGGRVTLIKSILASLLIFYMSLFRMPIKVSQELEIIQ
ncbi:Reverse transcriptase domain - like 10 [Theobroma cacao]|nr:Reverse transcriptase domain - like 10 [Theobroma cacao]